MSRLDILKKSLEKKNAVVDAKISGHFKTVSESNAKKCILTVFV